MGMFCIMLLSGILFTNHAVHHSHSGRYNDSNVLLCAYTVYFVLMIMVFILSFLLKPNKK